MKVEERQSSFLGMKKRGESDCEFLRIWAWLSFVKMVFEACIVHVLCGVVSNGAAYDLLKIAEDSSPSPIAAQRATGTSLLVDRARRNDKSGTSIVLVAEEIVL
jgi:hypothetical protein